MSNALSRRTVGPALLPGGAAAERHHRAWLRRFLADLPDPEQVAYQLDGRALHPLLTAWQTRAGWRVEAQFAAELARAGLCECRGPFLTAFGLAVRRVAGREDA